MAANSAGWRSSRVSPSGIIPVCRQRRSTGCWYAIPPASANRKLLSTDLMAKPEQILGWFVSRWRMETTFQEARTHLGMETQRQWSDLGDPERHRRCLGCSR